MADIEKFDFGKFVGSFFQILPWVKTFRYVIGAVLIIGVILFVYFKFKPQTQNTTFSGSVGKVNIISNPKRSWWIPIPFVEIYGYKENDRQGTGGKFGARWEF